MHFIADRDPAAAERVLDAMERTFQELARHPDSGASHAKPQTARVANVPGKRFSELPGVLSCRNRQHPDSLRYPRRKASASIVSARTARMKLAPPRRASFTDEQRARPAEMSALPRSMEAT